MFASICQVMSPFTLRYLIAFANRAYVAAATGQPIPHIGEGIGLVLGVRSNHRFLTAHFHKQSLQNSPLVSIENGNGWECWR